MREVLFRCHPAIASFHGFQREFLAHTRPLFHSRIFYGSSTRRILASYSNVKETSLMKV